VVTALKKYKDKVAVVTWDWLEDCVMKSKRCLQTKKYLWRKPEKRKKTGMLGDWRKPERKAAGALLVGVEERAEKTTVEGELSKGEFPECDVVGSDLLWDSFTDPSQDDIMSIPTKALIMTSHSPAVTWKGYSSNTIVYAYVPILSFVAFDHLQLTTHTTAPHR